MKLKTKTLSISIAAYNVEKYLEHTLKSFCAEEVMQDLEVLIIDDGSSDGTGSIAARFSEQYRDTFRYIRKENGGHGSTVNLGIEECTGKYFKVVDGDDWVDNQSLSELISYLKHTDTDLVLTDFTRVCEDGSLRPERYFTHFEAGHVYSFHDLPSAESIAMHSMCIKSSILKQSNIRLAENCFYVDIEYVVKSLNVVDTIVYLPLDVYQYRYGTPNQSVSLANMKKNISMRIKVSQELASFVEESRNTPGYDSARFDLISAKVAKMIAGTCCVYLAFDDVFEAKKQLVAYENSIKSVSNYLYQLSGNSAKVRFMRMFSHLFFGLENRFYHLFKM